ncbi:MAG: CRISPR system precrRNA processing endoribonuclease RAMP protein Cas6 [Syntrophomonadaceae bacterium]|nr:CRISPR system precrRNA processing endoribonuclease RAMP protein Cas6 [Syntrophomonadaceae bacterium]
MVNFPISELEMRISPKTRLSLPKFREGAVRGALGSVFHRMVCSQPRNKECAGCALVGRCAFSVVFAPSSQTENGFMSGQASVPRPYMVQIQGQGEKREFTSGQILTLKLVLIGRGIQYYPYFLLSFLAMGQEGIGNSRYDGETGKFKLLSVSEKFPDGKHKRLYNTENPEYSTDPTGYEIKKLLDYEVSKVDKCTVHMESPLRVRKKGRLLSELPFEVLMKSVVTRLNALSRHFGNGCVEYPSPSFWEKTKMVRVCDAQTSFCDYYWGSVRQERKIKLGGITGSITYEGDLTPFINYLKLAEKTGVGKNTTFGFGRIRLETGVGRM